MKKWLLAVAMFALLSACTGGSEGELARFTFTSELVTAADAPVKLAAAPDGRTFYSEYRAGNIRIISADGQLLEQPFAHVDVAEFKQAGVNQWGLFGLAFDPEFETNHYLYAYLIRPTADGGQAAVMRFTDIDNQGTDPTVILADLPKARVNATLHVGGNILFGPDGYLYLSLGDFGPGSVGREPQDLSLLQGKILRVDKADGSAPPDNPFVDDPDADPRIFAYGLRNPYDFTFHPTTGRMYATDNGQANCDELNIVDKGENYGWPQSLDDEVCHNPGAVEPIYLYAMPGKRPEEEPSNVGPTAVEFLTDSGELLLTCEVNTGFMRLLLLEGPDYDVVKETRVLAEDCTLDIAAAPDGSIYYSNATEIRRLVPIGDGS